MNYNFMAEVAPELALPPRGEWVAADQQNLYSSELDSSGERVPLPYMQEGGQREFFSPGGAERAATGLDTSTAGTAAPTFGATTGRRNVTIRPMPLRGVELPNLGPATDSLPYAGPRVNAALPPPGAPAQQNLLEEAPVESYIGSSPQRRPLPDVVRNPIMGVHGRLRSEAQMDQMRRYYAHEADPRYMGTRETLDLPPAGGRSAPEYNPHYRSAPNQNLEYSRQIMDAGGQNTLLDMIELRTQFPISEFLRNLGAPRREAPTQQQGPVRDLRGRTGDTQRTGQWNRSRTYNLSTPEGLAEFNERMGLNLGNQMRTREEQRSLYERGLSPTLESYHLTGDAFDVPPRFIGGLTGENAVGAVRVRMMQAGYNPDDYEIKWETGTGPNQGTGAHVHVEPRRRR